MSGGTDTLKGANVSTARILFAQWDIVGRSTVRAELRRHCL